MFSKVVCNQIQRPCEALSHILHTSQAKLPYVCKVFILISRPSPTLCSSKQNKNAQKKTEIKEQLHLHWPYLCKRLIQIRTTIRTSRLPFIHQLHHQALSSHNKRRATQRSPRQILFITMSITPIAARTHRTRRDLSHINLRINLHHPLDPRLAPSWRPNTGQSNKSPPVDFRNILRPIFPIPIISMRSRQYSSPRVGQHIHLFLRQGSHGR